MRTSKGGTRIAQAVQASEDAEALEHAEGPAPAGGRPSDLILPRGHGGTQPAGGRAPLRLALHEPETGGEGGGRGAAHGPEAALAFEEHGQAQVHRAGDDPATEGGPQGIAEGRKACEVGGLAEGGWAGRSRPGIFEAEVPALPDHLELTERAGRDQRDRP